MRRFFGWLIGLPLAILLVLLSVANRTPVRLALDPFSGETPAYAIEVPLFAVVFVALATGLIVGGAATWLGQRHWRRAARVHRDEAAGRRAEPERPGEQQPRLAPPPRA